MKIKQGFVLREVAGSYMVIGIGSRMKDFNGVITLSGSGAMLWKELEKGASKEELVSFLLNEYEVDAATAEKDVSSFLEKLESINVLED